MAKTTEEKIEAAINAAVKGERKRVLTELRTQATRAKESEAAKDYKRGAADAYKNAIAVAKGPAS